MIFEIFDEICMHTVWWLYRISVLQQRMLYLKSSAFALKGNSSWNLGRVKNINDDNDLLDLVGQMWWWWLVSISGKRGQLDDRRRRDSSYTGISRYCCRYFHQKYFHKRNILISTYCCSSISYRPSPSSPSSSS